MIPLFGQYEVEVGNCRFCCHSPALWGWCVVKTKQTQPFRPVFAFAYSWLSNWLWHVKSAVCPFNSGAASERDINQSRDYSARFPSHPACINIKQKLWSISSYCNLNYEPRNIETPHGPPASSLMHIICMYECTLSAHAAPPRETHSCLNWAVLG